MFFTIYACRHAAAFRHYTLLSIDIALRHSLSLFSLLIDITLLIAIIIFR